ncbi:MAG: hypothetical protein AAFQ07_09415 [Chloroflexota bacterium]
MSEHELLPPQKTAIDNLTPRISSADLQALADETAFQKFNATKSDNTLKAYRRDLQRFAHLIYGDDVPDDYGYRLSTEKDLWQNLTHGEANAYQLWMMQAGYALTSINRAVYAVRTYARQAMLAGVMSADVYQRIAAIQSVSGKAAANLDEKRLLQRRPVKRAKKAHPTKIPADLVTHLLNDHDLAQLQGQRDAVLMGCLLELGLRASEMATLTWDDMNLTTGTIQFYRPKVAQMQQLALSTRLQRMLRLYHDHLQLCGDLPDKLLIGVTRTGAPGKPYLLPQANLLHNIGN